MTNVLTKRLHAIGEGCKKRWESLSKDTWYHKAATACEDVSDAIQRTKSGTSSRIAKGVAGKLGVAGTSAGIFSIASLLGTASTGTAVGTLSGAAFTSAALAWIGGTVFMGSIILGVASIAGGIGVVVSTGWLMTRYLYGKKREETELEKAERNIIDVCLSLSMAFRQQENSGTPLDPMSARALYGDALKPLSDDLLTLKQNLSGWPYMAKQRISNAVQTLEEITSYLRRFSQSNPNVTVGVVTAVFLQLLADDVSSFDENEQLVLDALRRSKTTLANASTEDLADYVQSKEPSQLLGLQKNVKGIYHELRFAQEENADDDEYIVELFDATNHPGSDVRIINEATGDIREVQLKATDYLSYVKQHNEQYENIDVFATTEVAKLDPGIGSTGMSNRELIDDVQKTIDGLGKNGEIGVVSSMTVAAMVSLARNVRVVLRGGRMTKEDKSKLMKDGMISAGVAGIVSLLIG